MFYVYLLQSVDSSSQYYVGFTNNLQERLVNHNLGLTRHTNKYKPWKVIFYAAFEKKQTAFEFERYLKSGSGVAFRHKRLEGR